MIDEDGNEVKVCGGCGVHSSNVEWGTWKCKDCEQADGEKLV